MAPVRWLVEAALRRDLRGSFRRVCWVGDWPPALPEGPVIAYSNHHHVFDGHLAWLLFQSRLGRPVTVWMEEWDRFPFFAAVGAQPFPPAAPQRRAATLCRTAHRFQERPQTVLVYYPGGRIHPPEEGIPSFDASELTRLADLYHTATWWPYAVHVTWRDAGTPTAFVTGGDAHEADGSENDRLARLLATLRRPDLDSSRILLEGTPGRAERWDFSFARSFFERYL